MTRCYSNPGTNPPGDNEGFWLLLRFMLIVIPCVATWCLVRAYKEAEEREFLADLDARLRRVSTSSVCLFAFKSFELLKRLNPIVDVSECQVAFSCSPGSVCTDLVAVGPQPKRAPMTTSSSLSFQWRQQLPNQMNQNRQSLHQRCHWTSSRQKGDPLPLRRSAIVKATTGRSC